MTTRPDHGHELIARPKQTPEAVRVALARVAPHQLSDMERHKEQAIAAALTDGEIGHLQHWLTYWLAQVEIERRPELSARYRVALAAVHGTVDRDDPAFRSGMNDLAAVEAEARRPASA